MKTLFKVIMISIFLSAIFFLTGCSTRNANLTEAQILAYVQTALEFDEFIQNRELNIEHIILGNSFSIEGLSSNDRGMINIPIRVAAINESVIFEFWYNALFLLDDNGWKKVALDLVDRESVPVTPMPQSEIDAFVATLGFHYFSLVERITYRERAANPDYLGHYIDLGYFIDFDKLHYTATNQYPFLEETYQLFVFPLFDFWEGRWDILSRTDIEQHIVEQYWDISGRWEFNSYRPWGWGTPSYAINFWIDIEGFEEQYLYGKYYFRYQSGNYSNVAQGSLIPMNRNFFEDRVFWYRAYDYYYEFGGRRQILILDRNIGLRLRIGITDWRNPIRVNS